MLLRILEKISLLSLLLIFTANLSFSQSLSLERVAKIKKCTARITIENDNSVGTGFVIDNYGTILTCWHVVRLALNVDQTTKQIKSKKIFVTFSNGQKVEYGIPMSWFNVDVASGVAYDFCPLVPIISMGNNIDFLKLGNFNTAVEGQEVYTCGYPLGINQQFISKGIISTKFVDTTLLTSNGSNIASKVPYNLALIDMTMNRGNSGGAIIAIGDNINNDEVIGIADFIINPIGQQADTLIATLNQNSGGVFIGNVAPVRTLSTLTSILSSTSNGVSGCVSINHSLISFQKLKK